MSSIGNIIGCIVALFLLGVLATFFIMLNINKEEVWYEIYRRMNERSNEIDDK